MKNKKIIITIIVIVLAIFISLAVYNAINENETTTTMNEVGPSKGTLVEIDYVEAEDIVNIVSADGQVEMISRSVVYSPSTAKVDVVNFNVGDKVKKGEVLLSYKDDSIEALKDELTLANLDLKSGQLVLESITIPPSEDQILQLEAQLRTSANTIDLAKKQVEQVDLQIENINDQLLKANKELDNGKVLYSNGIITKKELDALESTVNSILNNIKTITLERENAVEAVNSARFAYGDVEKQIELLSNKNESKSVVNQVESQKINIERLKLRIQALEKEINEFEVDVIAEKDGAILTKNVEIGTTVQKGATLFTIGDTSKENLIIKANVLEYDSGMLEIGQEAIITGDSLGNKEVKGTLSKIYPTVEDKLVGTTQKKVVVVEIEAEGNDLALRSGSTVEATITTSVDYNKTVVPLMSILTDTNGEDYIFIIKDDFSLEKRIIEIVQYTGESVAINNVEIGEKIVNNPYSYLSDGEFVKYIDDSK